LGDKTKLAFSGRLPSFQTAAHELHSHFRFGALFMCAGIERSDYDFCRELASTGTAIEPPVLRVWRAFIYISSLSSASLFVLDPLADTGVPGSSIGRPLECVC